MDSLFCFIVNTKNGINKLYGENDLRLLFALSLQ